MKQQTISSSLRRGIHFIEEQVTPELNRLERAQLFLLLTDLPQASSLRSTLAVQLQALSGWDWILQDNLLEVFTVLNSLYDYDSTIINGACMAYVAQRLMNCESQVGGPYKDTTGKIDIAANVLIARFLACNDTVLPKLVDFLQQSIKNKEFESHALSERVIFYLFCQSKLELTEAPQTMFRNIQQPVDLSSPEQIALEINILLGIGEKPNSLEKQIAALQASQHTDGSWDHSTESSSVLLTTALVLQALNSYEQVMQPKNIAQISPSVGITEAARIPLLELEEPVRSVALEIWEHVRTADKNKEITLLPTFFARSLITPSQVASEALCEQLGTANFYCWMAYTIYDDFLDDEGQPARLPVANIAMRHSLRIYQDLLTDKPALENFAQTIFDVMDQANSWELTYCRFEVTSQIIVIGSLPRYGQRTVLANRAMGHALGPLIITELVADTQQQKDHIQLALSHYLIARQLNDDMHDWLKDVQAGQISYVVAAILRGLQIRPGPQNLPELTSRMQTYFQRTGLGQICIQLLRHVKSARRALDASGLIWIHSDFTTLLDSLEASATQAQTIYANQRDFLHTYKALAKTTRSNN